MEKINRSSRFGSFVTPVYILFILCIIRNINNYSQTDTNDSKWSVGIYGGVFVPTSEFYNIYNISPNIGVNCNYSFNPNIGISINICNIFLKPADILQFDEFGYITRPSANCFEITSSLKYNLFKKMPRIVLEAGMGFYEVDYKILNIFNGKNDVLVRNINNNYGFNVSAGLEFVIYKRIFSSLAFKYTYINSPHENPAGTYFNLLAGINYMF